MSSPIPSTFPSLNVPWTGLAASDCLFPANI
jgi:hypothetical protein